jgi:hypothetical protein
MLSPFWRDRPSWTDCSPAATSPSKSLRLIGLYVSYTVLDACQSSLLLYSFVMCSLYWPIVLHYWEVTC